MVSVVINVALKVLLMDRYAQVGLAFATSVGVWVNFALLVAFAVRRKLIAFDDRLRSSSIKLAVAGGVLALGRLPPPAPVMRLCESLGSLRFVAALAILGTLSAVVYGGAVLVLLGPPWFRAFGSRPAR